MFGGRLIVISREGWYFLFVVAFVLVGAVLREINLLVLLAGLMIGPLLFSWRYAAVSMRELTARRQVPPRISAGELLPVYLTVGNRRTRIANWMLCAEDAVQREGSPRRQRTNVEVVFSHIPAGHQRSASYRVRATRRGRYQLGPLRLHTKFPLGLVRGSYQLKQFDSFIVCPRVGHLSRAWHALIRGERSGAHASRSRAGSADGDFYALREWRAGDSRHLIHWRTSARIGGLAVKQLEQRTTPSLVIVLDLYLAPEASQQPEPQALVELALSLAGTAVNDLTDQGRSRLVFTCSAQTLDSWSAPMSALFARELLDFLAVVQPGDGRHLLDAMEQAVGQRPLGAKIVVISTRPRATAGPAVDPRELEAPLEWVDVSDHDRLGSLFSLDEQVSNARPEGIV